MPCRIAGFKQASACQPLIRKIIAFASSTVFYFTIYSLALLFNSLPHIKNPRNHKDRKFHPNKRLPHAIFSFFWCPDFHDTGLETGARFPAKSSSGNRCPIWAARGWRLSVASFVACQHRLRPKPGHPKSKIQTGRSGFGFWNLGFGFWSSDFGFLSLDFGFWSLDFGVWSLDFGVWSLDFRFWTLDFVF